MAYGATMQMQPSPRGTTPLVYACWYGHIDVIEFLVDLGADVNAEFNQLGYNPILSAAKQQHEEVVKFLLRQGADPFVYANVRRCKNHN